MPCFGSLRCTSRASATADTLTLPSTVGEERAIAPLLRGDDLAVERHAGRALVDRTVAFV